MLGLWPMPILPDIRTVSRDAALATAASTHIDCRHASPPASLYPCCRWSLILLFPYHLVVRIVCHFYRTSSGENVFDEVCQCWLCSAGVLVLTWQGSASADHCMYFDYAAHALPFMPAWEGCANAATCACLACTMRMPASACACLVTQRMLPVACLAVRLLAIPSS